MDKQVEGNGTVVAASDVNEDGSNFKLKASDNFSKSGKDLFFRADKIDLRSLDIQLEKTLSRIWLKERSNSQKPKEEWEIDPSKLEIRYVVAQGTYGTVYRGTYYGQDVAGYLLLPLRSSMLITSSFIFHL